MRFLATIFLKCIVVAGAGIWFYLAHVDAERVRNAQALADLTAACRKTPGEFVCKLLTIEAIERRRIDQLRDKLRLLKANGS